MLTGKTKSREVSLPAGRAGREEGASDSALPAFPTFWVEVKQSEMWGTKEKGQKQNTEDSNETRGQREEKMLETRQCGSSL